MNTCFQASDKTEAEKHNYHGVSLRTWTGRINSSMNTETPLPPKSKWSHQRTFVASKKNTICHQTGTLLLKSPRRCRPPNGRCRRLRAPGATHGGPLDPHRLAPWAQSLSVDVDVGVLTWVPTWVRWLGGRVVFVRRGRGRGSMEEEGFGVCKRAEIGVPGGCTVR